MKLLIALLLTAACFSNTYCQAAGNKYEVINFLLKNVNNKYNRNYKLYLCSKPEQLVTDREDSLNIISQLATVGVSGKELSLQQTTAPSTPFLATTGIRQPAVITSAFRFQSNEKEVYIKNGKRMVRTRAAPKVRYYSFSDPLFFKGGTVCVVLHSYASGATSGGHCHYLLQRKGGGWKVMKVFDCVSY